MARLHEAFIKQLLQHRLGKASGVQRRVRDGLPLEGTQSLSKHTVSMGDLGREIYSKASEGKFS